MEGIVSCWDLIEQGKFKEACVKADEEYELTKSSFILRNKVLALLHLQEFNEAINICKDLIEKEMGESEYDFKLAGTAYWLIDEHSKAVEMWRRGLETNYTDASGGVEIPSLLYFAAISLNDKLLEKDAVNILKKKRKSKRVLNWPGPLAKYLLGDINQQELLESVALQKYLREKQLCQAQFYIAIIKLRDNEREAYAEFLKRSVCLGAASYQKQEYYLAKGELDKNT